MIHTFTKDKQGWYISSIPHPHPFSRGALAMVAGADTFLDMLSEGEDTVTLGLETEAIEGYEILHRKELVNLGVGGANYIVKSYKGIEIEHHMWLCPVTFYVFKMYPKTIYFTKLN